MLCFKKLKKENESVDFSSVGFIVPFLTLFSKCSEQDILKAIKNQSYRSNDFGG